MEKMRVLVTGSAGFIGKNLLLRLSELKTFTVTEYTRDSSAERLQEIVKDVDAVVHLAGENRPLNPDDFAKNNTGLTQSLCDAIRASGRKISLIYTSSIQAELSNPYGESKLAAERAIEALAGESGTPALIYRLPGVFGKWCKPNYNSVVATFCHNIANGLPIRVNEPSARLRLVYVDDVVNAFVAALSQMHEGLHRADVNPEYSITLGDLAAQIEAFKECRTSLISEQVGTGLTRALYATYVSYLPTSGFAYQLPRYGDERGIFVEMLKTKTAGQFSYFTAHPGITRGGHYHHTKTEKFLVMKGTARFGFRHVLTNETFELVTSGALPQVVETVPGWTHDITNIGEDELVVMLWANEIFDRERPDTIAMKVHP